MAVYKIDLGTGERLGLLATATVSDGGWVDLGTRSSCGPVKRSSPFQQKTGVAEYDLEGMV